MKLTKKLKGEILKVYQSLWDANLRGDIKTFGSFLDDKITLYGTAAGEIFKSKKDAVKFYKATADQMIGKVEFRKRKIDIKAIGDTVVLNEQCDLYVFTEKTWLFYGHARISSLFEQKQNLWKVVNWHASFPDSRTEEGDQINTDKIKAENIKLRDAVRRRTEELEDKNRELEIESSLERVRTVAMGMKQPKDMIDVCRTISKQLQLLKVENIRNVQTAIINDEKGTYLNYEYFTQYKTTSVLEIVTKLHPKVQEFADTIKKSADAFFTTSFKGAALKKWRDYRKKTGQNADPILDKAKSLHYYFYSIGPGALGLSAYSPLNEEEINIFHRFRNVFGLAYKRFTDIQKAETQAREAQIEASLEKVRAQALGMRKSEDLPNVCQVLFKELKRLGFSELRNAMVNIHNDEKRTFVNYDYSDEIGKSITPLFYDIHPVIKKQIREIRKADDAFSETVFKGKDLESWKAFRKSRGEKEDKRIKNSTALYYYFYSIGTGSIGISTFNGISEEKKEVLKRFRNVFAFAYRRYMDVAQAEAQAKEAQIELGLERVRARAMAMQNSDELAELVSVVFKELTQLDFALTSCIIWISDTQTLANTLWVTSAEMNKPAEPVRLKPFHHSFFHSIIHAWKEKDPKWIYILTGKEKTSFEKVFFADEPDMPVALKKALSVPKKVVFSASFNNFGALEILGTEPLTDEKFEILHRFGKVFDSSYTRFNDLKKAEAQAREAQIEVSVERVRAKALAMHKSGEIMGVAVTMRKELESLNIPGFDAVTITLKQDDGTTRLWDNTSAKQHEDGTWENTEWVFRLEENHPDFYINRIWKSDKKYFVEEQDENDLKVTIDMVRKFDKAMAVVVKHHFKENRIKHAWHPTVQLTHGKLNLDFYGAPQPEVETILLKMGAAFDLAYKRFLDLQKAEAQTREAKIEAALERTRTQSMIMQHSTELDDVLRVFHQQVLLLGINSAFSFLWLPDEKNDRHIFWAAWGENENNSTVFKSKAINYPLDRNEPATAQCLIDWKSNEPVYSYHVPPAAVENYFAVWQELIDGVEHLKPEYFSGGLHYVEAFMKYGCFGVMVATDLSEDEKKILSRFAVEFERTYTRFLDLQKAEAQAREAQIETGLERVRSKTMAMHKSEEVTDVAVSLNEELLKLGFKGGSTILINKESGDTEQWTGFSENKTLKSCYVPYFKHPYHDALFDAWKKDEKFLVYTVAGDEKRSLDEHYFKTGYKEFPESDKKWMRQMPSVTFSHAFMKYGAIHWGPDHLTDEQLRILQRFSKVFEQSYTRFLDLQKAEAQAREAQIEAALERVRSRTMAMHSSNDLLQVINVLSEQLRQLGFNADAVSFITDGNEQGYNMWLSSPGDSFLSKIYVPRINDKTTHLYEDAKKDGRNFYSYTLTKDQKDFYFKNFFENTILKSYPEEEKQKVFDAPGMATTNVLLEKIVLSVSNFSAIPYNDQDNIIIKRFAFVFEQSFTRFLDLQKAEAQAREAQIQLALERVRARTMAMQKSDELKEVAHELRVQLAALGTGELETCAINLYEEYNESVEAWAAVRPPDSPKDIVEFHFLLPKKGIYIIEDMLQAYASGVDELGFELAGTKGTQWMRTMESLVPDMFAVAAAAPDFKKSGTVQAWFSVHYFSGGALVMVTMTPPLEESRSLLKRCAQVFGLAYRRFADLKKAEAQAREATIETALERVRSRSMSMQKSEDLKEVIKIVYQQLRHLNINLDHAGFVVDYTPGGDWHFWIADEQDIPSKITHPYFESVWANQFNEAKEKGEDFFATHLNFEEKNKFYNELLSYVPGLPEASKDFYLSCPGLAASTVLFDNVSLYIENFSGIPYSFEENKILMRFGNVFQQTYTRFLDLQKAEAQAREAQFENALEKVRSRTMAMQHSDELPDAAINLFLQVQALGIPVWAAGYCIWDEDKQGITLWMSSEGVMQDSIHAPITEDPSFIHMKEAYERGDDFYVEGVGGEALVTHYKYVRSLPVAGKILDSIISAGHPVPTFQIFHCVYFSQGFLLFTTYEAVPEAYEIFKRFGKVFDQTYTRFLDLQKAEAQAREAKIETALEKVRSRTMAMQKSIELGDVATILFKEMNQLVDNLWSCGFVLCEKDRAEDEWWLSTETGFIPAFYLPNTGDRVHENLYTGWKNGEIYRAEQIEGAELDQHYEWLMSIPVSKKIFDDMAAGGFKKPVWQKLHGAYFSKGYLVIITQVPCKEEEVFKRFAQVFDLTYTRFLDLQKAEAQAREAQIEAALERVRSRTMAMQKSEELPDAANVLFMQVQSLGIPAWSCGYNILAEDKKSSTCIMSSEGEIQVPFVLPLTEHSSLLPWYEAIKNNLDFFVYGQGGEDLIEHYKYLATVPGLEEVFRQFDNAGISLPENQINHLVRFTNGFLLFITYEPVPHAHDIFIRFGKVFEQTYTRFLDLQLKEEQALRLREEKEKLEHTLGELQTTQKQLIQSEKMASLGELTAGIAHEIQNPLNFVNNFSEVSNELIQEMMEEVEKGNYDLAKEIAEDIKQNLEKINNHGKRADGIVKGMLQHSRSSAGTKEPTDINALCDEYLRLSYHGLRAKDKSFNAKFETGFDETVGKISVMPQDIGRVVLNLINNAFYAVDEKKKQNQNGYEPVVTVNTKKLDDMFEITVKDNGNGIPQKILDKIFQPFFTTKPTGQGTGLGLSLAYDIIKVHGGEIKVETKEGEGTSFIISLPVNQ